MSRADVLRQRCGLTRFTSLDETHFRRIGRYWNTRIPGMIECFGDVEGSHSSLSNRFPESCMGGIPSKSLCMKGEHR